MGDEFRKAPTDGRPVNLPPRSVEVTPAMYRAAMMEPGGVDYIARAYKAMRALEPPMYVEGSQPAAQPDPALSARLRSRVYEAQCVAINGVPLAGDVIDGCVFVPRWRG